MILETIKRNKEIQEVFGILVKTAMENGIECFHSDLYHDAVWLQENWKAIHDAGGFYFSCRLCGTAINLESSRNVDSGGTGEKIYRFSFVD